MTQAKQDEFLMLLSPVHDRLWRFALAMTRDRDDAEDLMSETILASYERFHTIRDPQAFTSFLFTVATRLQRHKERRGRWFGYIDRDEASQIASSGDSPELSTDIRLVREAIASLPAKQREAVTLFELSGFSLEEIRAIQGGTLSGVKSRLRRGRIELGKKLGVAEDSGGWRDERGNSTEIEAQSQGDHSRINQFFATSST
jgi:RNA polymerase sigma-70 factor (ECF subfamily)